MNILIVEDDLVQMKLAHVVLSYAGYNVSKARGVKEAWETLQTNRPTLILLDLSLPGIDGFALARMIRNDRNVCQIPIIAITSYPDRYTRFEALKAGCSAYMVKPIDTRFLSKAIEDTKRDFKMRHQKNLIDLHFETEF
ncbi:response regulator receiver domain protein [Leptospira fainei serovar Hurstbridge str. BUT 6]|uniref:Response regulator receiver domain protein n=1 Tax=Leptospira fainei serovar Hurstbridge str. BUT 6 TaxID=1193011 RepID=S3V893_9LEPT|nr:response regulator [Leptospira fainei]EPG72620.1 response regulator receiver domain protein [Leptospira fainei serovar Hurstbridge str. BUT 6]